MVLFQRTSRLGNRFFGINAQSPFGLSYIFCARLIVDTFIPVKI